MFFYSPSERVATELLPGVETKTFWGEKMLISLVDLVPGATIPSHQHPHEQVGTVIRGEFDLTIGDESRHVRPGDVYIIPSQVSHSVKVGTEAVQVFEVFSPVREEYKFT